jgi:hypothetical protein
MQGFKKEKTAGNQLFDTFIKEFLADCEEMQKSSLFEMNLINEAVFVNQLDNLVIT